MVLYFVRKRAQINARMSSSYLEFQLLQSIVLMIFQVSITKFLASDKDSGVNSNLTFSASGLDPKFEVKPDGQLWAKESLQGIITTFTFNLIVSWNL